eukprot:1262218-Alexandrium_andersonii.AAC.1
MGGVPPQAEQLLAASFHIGCDSVDVLRKFRPILANRLDLISKPWEVWKDCDLRCLVARAV